MDAVDHFEPYATELPPLPKNRDREVVPPQYDVPACVRENEGSAPFACPRLGCDGLALESAEECHRHEDRYHSPPYWCGECDASFAAEPALQRHLDASGHRIWVCRERGCDMEGIQFLNKDRFVAHALESMNHRAIDLRRQTAEPRGRTGLGVEQGVDGDGDEMMEDVLSDCPSEVGEMCTQPCCHKFQHFFVSSAEWERHANSHAHVSAAKLFEALAEMDLSAEELQQKRAAARGFTCDSVGCLQYGKKLSTSQSYYRHVETSGHKEPRPTKKMERERKSLEKAALNPTVKEAMRVRMVCEEVACARFGAEFRSARSWFRHAAGVVHVRATRFGEVMRRMEWGAEMPGDVGAGGGGGGGCVEQQVGFNGQPYDVNGQQRFGLDGLQQSGMNGLQRQQQYQQQQYEVNGQQQSSLNGCQQSSGLDGFQQEEQRYYMNGQQQFGLNGGEQQQLDPNLLERCSDFDGQEQQHQRLYQRLSGAGHVEQEYQGVPGTGGPRPWMQTILETPGRGSRGYGDVFPLSPEGSGTESTVYATPTKQQMPMQMPMTPVTPVTPNSNMFTQLPSWREEVLQQRNVELEEQIRGLKMELSQMKLENEKRVEMLLERLNHQMRSVKSRGDVYES